MAIWDANASALSMLLQTASDDTLDGVPTEAAHTTIESVDGEVVDAGSGNPSVTLRIACLRIRMAVDVNTGRAESTEERKALKIYTGEYVGASFTYWL